jgi:Cu/Ag efflux protein CusF
MRRKGKTGFATAAALGCACLLSVLVSAQPPGAKSHAFRGRVERLDPRTGAITVDGENVDGWMMAMSMGYRVDKPEVLAGIKVGDVITATVYDGDFNTLYDVKVETPAAANAGDDLPPVSYVCPSPGEESYLDDKPGRCPMSGADLVPVRLVTAYSCLRVQLPLREAPGLCPVDRSELVPVTAGMYFTCQSDPSVHELGPGACADGSARIKAFERRPHGDHNPRHGGGFIFMAQDQWHHLEGTFVEPGLFRVYFYDDMTRPLSVAGVTGRLVMADSNAREIGPSMPLTQGRSPDGSTLEARIPNATFPFNVKLFMTFKPNDREQVFDFTFTGYSKEP